MVDALSLHTWEQTESGGLRFKASAWCCCCCCFVEARLPRAKYKGSMSSSSTTTLPTELFRDGPRESFRVLIQAVKLTLFPTAVSVGGKQRLLSWGPGTSLELTETAVALSAASRLKSSSFCVNSAESPWEPSQRSFGFTGMVWGIRLFRSSSGDGSVFVHICCNLRFTQPLQSPEYGSTK